MPVLCTSKSVSTASDVPVNDFCKDLNLEVSTLPLRRREAQVKPGSSYLERDNPLTKTSPDVDSKCEKLTKTKPAEKCEEINLDESMSNQNLFPLNNADETTEKLMIKEAFIDIQSSHLLPYEKSYKKIAGDEYKLLQENKETIDDGMSKSESSQTKIIINNKILTTAPHSLPLDQITKHSLQSNATERQTEDKQFNKRLSVYKTTNNAETLSGNLLEALGESLPDDCLQDVAELVENKEIQEIIDKQVLGEKPLSETATTICTATISETKKMKELSKAATGRRISKLDSNAVSIPPIEKPTTRPIKRALRHCDTEKSLLTTCIKNANSYSFTDESVPLPKLTEEKNADISSAKFEINDDLSRKGKARKRKLNPAVIAVLQDDDEYESDQESWNSEDDPDR